MEATEGSKNVECYGLIASQNCGENYEAGLEQLKDAASYDLHPLLMSHQMPKMDLRSLENAVQHLSSDNSRKVGRPSNIEYHQYKARLLTARDTVAGWQAREDSSSI